MAPTYRAIVKLNPVKTSGLHHIFSRALLLGAVAITLCGCNLQKLADTMESHESHFPSGHQSATGGVSYSTSASTRDWSRTLSTCRSETAAAQTTIQFGADGGDVPLTIVQDSTGPTTLQLKTPDGLLTFNRSSCDPLKANPIPDTNTTPSPGDTGYIVFDCASGGKTVRGAVKFNQCGK